MNMLHTAPDPLHIPSNLVVVSNRLPVSRVRRRKKVAWETSPGGLVSALRPILRSRRCSWIGWPGVAEHVEPFDFEGIQNIPVGLSAAEVKVFYEGFCNRALWPLYHDVIRPPEFSRDGWYSYVEVNRRYAEAAVEAADDDTMIWVHDYHLHLVPEMIRAMRPDASIGFFLHVPFPPQELFAQLPWRRELIRGMLGADVVGFQTLVGAQNFAQVSRRFVNARGDDETILLDGREIRIGCFPISIDYDHYNTLAAGEDVAARRVELRKQIGPARQMLLGVDRLDYTKGIDVRLQAFRELLKSGRATNEQCVMVQIAVPSRERVPEYRELKTRIERLVGEINGEFGEIGHSPVHYLHRSVDAVELSALYGSADVMLVTPLRDGMNLVCKEYIASRTDNSGVLVLSEFAGAAREFPSALEVNPHDIDGMVNTLDTALRMPAGEQMVRMSDMRRIVSSHNVYTWAAEFFETLERAHAA